MIAKFGLPVDKATPLVHSPKALKRPRNNAGPASNNMKRQTVDGKQITTRKKAGNSTKDLFVPLLVRLVHGEDDMTNELVST